MMKGNEILQHLAHFHGSSQFYKIALLNTRYTEGINYLANAADCYWLVTDASVMAKSLNDKSRFLTIDFKRHPRTKEGPMATITYTDGNDMVFCTQEYGFTDFPLNKLRLYFVDNTLMLPSEY